MEQQRIQEVLGVMLSSVGQHELARQAFESTSRLDWVRLGDAAMRHAPEYNRTHVGFVVKLALDSPDNGGPNDAADFEIRKEKNELTDAPIYRAYRLNPPDSPKPYEYLGLAHHDIDKIERRIVGMYVARSIKKPE
jgi:hypothetical protein